MARRDAASMARSCAAFLAVRISGERSCVQLHPAK
jgi:hypothetical protein